MFSFLKSTRSLDNYAALAVDMHAHWLPGLDDGAETMEESLAMIRELQALGYRKLIATPHVMADFYQNTPAGIQRKLKEVRKASRKAKIKIQLAAAAEYLLDEGFEAKLRAGDLLTLPGNRVLVEFSFVALPPNVDQLLFDLQAQGYRPLLAHPERYMYLHDRFDFFRTLRERGVELQVNLLSLTGYYGGPVQSFAERMIKEGLVSFLGTDAHHAHHLEQLREALGNRHVARAVRDREWGNAGLGE